MIFQPVADTDVWHVFLYLFGPADGWFLTGPHSKMERVEAGNTSRLAQKHITFGTECSILLWQDFGKESSLLTGLCIFVW